MFNYEIVDGYITGTVGETPFSAVDTPEARVKAAEFSQRQITDVQQLKALQEEVIAWASTPLSDHLESESEYLAINRKTGAYHLKYNGTISSIEMPKALVDRILESHEKKIDFMPLIKMWVRFLRNPNLKKKGKRFADRFFNFVNLKYVHPKLKEEFLKQGFSDAEATKRATMYQMKITNEGLLNGYKVSREIKHKFDPETGEQVDRYKRTFNVNTGEIESEGLPEIVEDRLFEPAMQGQSGDAFSCSGPHGFKDLGHFIKVGCVHALPDWSMVDTNDDRSCVPGLHIGGLYYINNIKGEIHNIFVDPMHIGAVPDDSTGAVRCKQYFVHSSLAGVNGSIYHSSEYAKMTDAEWQAALDEAIKQKEALDAKAAERIEELKAL